MRRYILLLMLPLVMCALLFVGVGAVIADQIHGRAGQTAEQFRLRSFGMLREMQVVGDALLRDDALMRGMDAEDSRDVDALALCALIRESVKASPYIGHAYAVSDKNEHIFSDLGSFSYRALPVILCRLGVEEQDLTMTQPGQAEWSILNRNHLAPYCVISVMGQDGSRIGSLLVTLNMTEFLRIFFSLDADVACIFNDEFYIASELQTLDPDFNWRDQHAVNSLAGSPLTCFYLEAEDYTYLVGVSNLEYYRPLYLIACFFCMYLLIVLVFGLIYLYRISKKSHAQIASVIAALPTGRSVDAPLEELYADIRKALLDFRDQTNVVQIAERGRNLRSILYGHYSMELTADRLAAAGIYDPAQQFYIVHFFIRSLGSIPSSGADKPDVYEYVRVILITALENYSENRTSLAPCSDYGGVIAVFGSPDGNGLRDTVTEIVENAERLLLENYGISIQAIISSVATSPAGLRDAFHETAKLHSFAQSVDSDAPLLSQEDMLAGASLLLNGDFIRQERILINTILAGKYDVIPSMVSTILSEHISPLRKNYSLAQSRIQGLSTVLAEGVLAAGVPDMDVKAAVDRLHEADSVSSLNAAAKDIFGSLAELHGANRDDGVLSRAVHYIHTHLSDRNLGVPAVCEAAELSAQRLTRMFQSKYDMAIAEYINYTRVSQAKELLREKQLSVAKTAERVGYSNTDTFTRNFRKLEGVTPAEYRKLFD